MSGPEEEKREMDIADPDVDDIEQLLEKRDQLDALLKDKFTKVISVMFTDLKGSTALADKHGDIVSRSLVKRILDIIMPHIQRNNGIFVKTIGDGTLSYFDNAQDALRAAAQIQRGIDEYIVTERLKSPVLTRIGIHTGRCIIEKNDIFGDVVNIAARFESIADPGSIFLSEETYNALSDKSETYCKFVKTTTLKGKQNVFKAYKAFWNKDEIEAENIKDNSSAPKEIAAKKQISPAKKLIVSLLIVFLLLFLLIKGSGIKNILFSSGEKRSIQHSTDVPAPSPDKK